MLKRLRNESEIRTVFSCILVVGAEGVSSSTRVVWTVCEGKAEREACLVCKEVVEVKMSHREAQERCPLCGALDRFLALGSQCSLCKVGVVEEDKTFRIAI